MSVLVEDNSLLVCTFDGHGVQGQQVVDFCKSFTANYFAANAPLFPESPQLHLTHLCEQCDLALCRHPPISCAKSGTTAVFAYIHGPKVWVASVGDSKAVLAYIPAGGGAAARPGTRASRYCRVIRPDKLLAVRQLTVDQKPNLPQENARIVSHGGRVAQTKTKSGSSIGPFRVWKDGRGYPGLAMSRALGDSVARECGVIPTPIVTECPLQPQFDQFLVLCTDGVSDAIGNADIAYFVDKYRKCESGVAELLCKEARHRWLEFVEEEGTLTIDDISCVVIELTTAVPCLGRGDTEKRWSEISTYDSPGSGEWALQTTGGEQGGEPLNEAGSQ